MSTPLVTIGLPVYNGERYLADAIECILAQDYPNLELVIADNASTDSTRDIIATYAADPRVRWVGADRNRGAAWNYNRLLDEAKGEYFKWQADDDLVDPTFVRRCVEVLEQDRGAVLAYAYTTVIDDEGVPVRDLNDSLGVAGARPHERLAVLVDKLTFCNSVFGLIRTDVLTATRLIEPYQASDVSLLYELSLHGSFAEISEHLSQRRPGRSLKANRDKRSMANWFDTNARSGLRSPGWRLIRAHVGGVRRTPMPVADRLRCLLVLAFKWPVSYARQLRRTRRRLRNAAA